MHIGEHRIQVGSWTFRLYASWLPDQGWSVAIYAFDYQTGAVHEDRLSDFRTEGEALSHAVEECETFAALSLAPMLSIQRTEGSPGTEPIEFPFGPRERFADRDHFRSAPVDPLRVRYSM